MVPPQLSETQAVELEKKISRLTELMANGEPDVVDTNTKSSTLADHIVYNEEMDYYFCSLCDVKARTYYMMESHMNGKDHQKRAGGPVGGNTGQLPEHVNWDPETEYYICTLCDAKAASLSIMDVHLAGKDHKRRASYIGGNEIFKEGEPLPNYIKWDPEIEYFVCTLCDAKAATLYLMEGHIGGAKHVRNVAYAEEMEKASDPTKLPQHVVFDESSQFYVCTLCDAKAPTLYLMESHLGGKEHARRINMMANFPDWAVPGADSTSMPEHVRWDESLQFFICTLCDAKAATQYIMDAHLKGKEHKKKLANLEWYITQPPMNTEGAGEDNLPSYCSLKDGYFNCDWCKKKSASWDLLLIHLQGKEHSKICGNLGIAMFGENGHLEASKLFFEQYGSDIWARQVHWPETIIDSGLVWKCTDCNKKFSTPAAVNDHLPCDTEMTYPCPKKPVTRRQEPVKIQCYLCVADFPSMDDLWFHEQSDPIHQELVRVAVGIMPKGTCKPVDPRLNTFDI
jgi:hypothetical protein